jgi:hypothetical protein
MDPACAIGRDTPSGSVQSVPRAASRHPQLMVVIAQCRQEATAYTAVLIEPTGIPPPRSTPIARARTTAPKSAPLPGSASKLARGQNRRMTMIHANRGRKQRSKPSRTQISSPNASPNSGGNHLPLATPFARRNLALCSSLGMRPAA